MASAGEQLVAADVDATVREFFLASDEYRREEALLVPEAQLESALHLDELGRVHLWQYLEERFGLKWTPDHSVFVPETLGDVCDEMRRLLESRERYSTPQPSPLPPTPTVLLFAGQGAQRLGMGAQLCAAQPEARELFARASELLGYDLLDVCTNGPEERLHATEVAQPAILVYSIALARCALAERAAAGCVAVAGLSLGEYSALVWAGALSFDDAVRIVRERGAAMQAAAALADTSMISVLGLDARRTAEIVDAVNAELGGEQPACGVANLLCPGNTVVSGVRAALERVVEVATSGDDGARAKKCTWLQVSGAFHTHYMQPALERLERALADAHFSAPRVPVYLNVDAQPCSDPERIRDALKQQLVSTVRWHDTMRGMLDEDIARSFVEIGPGSVLGGLMRHCLKETPSERRNEVKMEKLAEVPP